MIEPKRNDVVGLSPLPGSVVHNAGGRCAPHRIPLRLTISVEKIDHFLVDMRNNSKIFNTEDEPETGENSIGRLSARTRGR